MEIKKRITKAKVQIQIKSSFFAYLSLYLKTKKDNSIPTACINAMGEMYYNEKFIHSLDDLELQGVILHEILHLAFLNLTRIGKKNHIMWNYATDLVNNTTILKEGKYKLPNKCLRADCRDRYKISGCNVAYYINNVSCKNADDVYSELLNIKNKFGGKIFNIEYNGIDTHNYKLSTPAEIKKIEKLWKDRIAEAVTVSKMMGDCPAEIEKIFDKLHREEIDWKTILQQIIIREIPNDYTLSKPNKKSYNYGVYIPSVLRDSVDISVVCDLSSSIKQEEFNSFFSEIVGMSRAFQNRINMTFYSHDTEPYNCGKIKNGNIEEIRKINLRGGGGTSFIPMVEMLKKDKPKLVVWLTDGYGDNIEDIDIPFKLVWVLTKNGSDKLLKCKGQILKLKI